jgi:putative hydrolase of HD superfamily
MALKRDLELLYEVGSLRFIERTWKQFLSPNFANLAEHHLRVVWIALLLAKYEGKGNTEKIMKMALVHDLGESRTGDLNYLTKQYASRNEDKAIKDIFKNTELEKEMVSLWHEYEGKKTIEAKIVKDADFLDVDFEIKEQESMGRKNMKNWSPRRKKISEKFYTNSAKKIWKAIQTSKPEDWYENPLNQYNPTKY